MNRRIVLMIVCATAIACGGSASQTKPTPAPQVAPAVDGDQEPEVAPVGRYAIDQQEVTFASTDTMLAGTLFRPRVDAAVPGVVILHDWGALGRDGEFQSLFGVRLPTEVAVYRATAEALSARGIAVLIFDKRTCVRGKESRCTYDAPDSERVDLGTALVEDAAAARSWLAAQDNIASTGFIGHGHGAAVAVAAVAGRQDVPIGLIQPPVLSLVDRARRELSVSRAQLEARIAEVGDTAEADLLNRQIAQIDAALKDPLGLPEESASDLAALDKVYAKAELTNALVVAGRVDPGAPDSYAGDLAVRFGSGIVLLDGVSRAMVGVSDDLDPTVVSAAYLQALTKFLGGDPPQENQ